MKRFWLAAALASAAFFSNAHPARALGAFCPARVSIEAQNDRSGAAVVPRSAGYGLELVADGPRSMQTATVIFDTDAGWFSAALPGSVFVPKVRTYEDDFPAYQRHQWVSPTVHVAFERPVQIARAWIGSAVFSSDPEGWSKLGQIACPPPASEHLESAGDTRRSPMRPSAWEPLWMPPAAGEAVVKPAKMAPLYAAACAHPFVAASAENVVPPEYPPSIAQMQGATLTGVIVLSLAPGGKLIDAAFWRSTGLQPFDDAALRAAKQATYTGAVSYCRPVPSEYFFVTTFSPH